MAGAPSDYHRGDMEIAEQKATYGLIMGFTKWGSLALAVLLVLLVVWFCTPGGFVSGAVSALVLLVLGVTFLREKPGAAH